MKKYAYRITGLLVVAAFISACGGGGGAGTSTGASPTPGTPTATADTSIPVPIYSAPSQATPLVTPALTGDVATDAIAWMNYRRAQVGLAPMVRNSLLDKAALAHANYLALNSYDEGHSETVGRAGFTGVTTPQRILSAGYIGTIVGENVSAARFKYGPVETDGLIDAPYHRSSQFGDYLEVGGGSAFTTSPTSPTGRIHNYVADFGGLNANWGPSASQVLVYPASGQKNAPTTWRALEAPNPLPDLAGQLVGYPISIQAASRAQLGISSFTLNDSKGAAMTGRLITSRTDSGQALRNHAFWIPLAPLLPATTYTAAVTGSLNSAPLNMRWSFTTAPTSSLTAVFSTTTLAATPGATVEIQLNGGSGYGVEFIGSSSSYGVYNGQNANNPVFATVTYISPTVATITRTATACNPVVFASCSFVMFGTDSSGVSVDFSITVK